VVYRTPKQEQSCSDRWTVLHVDMTLKLQILSINQSSFNSVCTVRSIEKTCLWDVLNATNWSWIFTLIVQFNLHIWLQLNRVNTGGDSCTSFGTVATNLAATQQAPNSHNQQHIFFPRLLELSTFNPNSCRSNHLRQQLLWKTGRAKSFGRSWMTFASSRFLIVRSINTDVLKVKILVEDRLVYLFHDCTL